MDLLKFLVLEYFASSSKPSIADFLAVEVISHACELANAANHPVGLPTRFPRLAAFVKRMARLPGIAEYTRRGGDFEASGLCFRCNNPHASWSGPGKRRQAFLSAKLTEGVGILSALLDGAPDERYANATTSAAVVSACPPALFSSVGLSTGISFLLVGVALGFALSFGAQQGVVVKSSSRGE